MSDQWISPMGRCGWVGLQTMLVVRINSPAYVLSHKFTNSPAHKLRNSQTPQLLNSKFTLTIVLVQLYWLTNPRSHLAAQRYKIPALNSQLQIPCVQISERMSDRLRKSVWASERFRDQLLPHKGDRTPPNQNTTYQSFLPGIVLPVSMTRLYILCWRRICGQR